MNIPATIMLRSLENSMQADTLTNAMEALQDFITARTADYHEQVKTWGAGNTDCFLDEIEDCQRALNKLGEALEQVSDYEHPEHDDED